MTPAKLHDEAEAGRLALPFCFCIFNDIFLGVKDIRTLSRSCRAIIGISILGKVYVGCHTFRPTRINDRSTHDGTCGYHGMLSAPSPDPFTDSLLVNITDFYDALSRPPQIKSEPMSPTSVLSTPASVATPVSHSVPAAPPIAALAPIVIPDDDDDDDDAGSLRNTPTPSTRPQQAMKKLGPSFSKLPPPRAASKSASINTTTPSKGKGKALGE